MSEAAQLTKSEAAAIRWRQGKLRWKLEPHQRAMYDTIMENLGGKFYLNCARRTGKSFTLCVIAIEFALRNPGSQIKYACKTQKNVKKIIKMHFRKIFRDCPKELLPKFSQLDGEFQFKNGSCIVVAGCDNENYETLRGTESHLNIVDEAGFIDDLAYVVNDVLLPMTLDTMGTTLLASTPPKSPGHESVVIASELEQRGKYVRFSLWDAVQSGSKRLNENVVNRFLDEARGSLPLEEFKKTPTYRREYLAEFVVDTDYAVVPEWTPEQEAASCVELERPQLFDAYVSTDMGFEDRWGTLFGYWDFRRAALVIEAELLLQRKTTSRVATDIKAIEKTLWEGQKEATKTLQVNGKGGAYPYLRCGDLTELELHNLYEHGLNFTATHKPLKEVSVNNLREWVGSGRIFIHPRCRMLIAQLRTTVWNRSRTDFERNHMGHGDLVDALRYMVQDINRNRNPFPDNVINFREQMYVGSSRQPKGTGSVVLGALLGRRK